MSDVTSPAPAPVSPGPKRDNLFQSLLVNVVIPSLVLGRLSTPEYLGPVKALLVALAFPIGFQLWDLLVRKEFSWIALFGFLNVLSTGALTLYASNHFWFAVKETAFPLLIGTFVFFSGVVDKPFLERIFFRPEVFDLEKLRRTLAERGEEAGFRAAVLRGNQIFTASFALSAALNYALAVTMLKSPVGSPEFNAELGKMTALSFPVITLPAMAVILVATWYLFRRIAALTGRPISEFLVAGN